jgi:P-type E1-E2 ATPase
MIAEVQTLATPLTRQMNRFGRVLSIVIIVMAGLLFLVGWLLHEYTLNELFLAAIGFAVAAIPEGLPAILTITLAIGVQRMARRNAITRKLLGYHRRGRTVEGDGRADRRCVEDTCTQGGI